MTIFLEQFRQIAAEQGWPNRTSPAGLVEQWSGFVHECEIGYTMGWDEYRNDLQCRMLLDAILTSPALREEPEFPEFRRNVDNIDCKFRELLIPGITLPIESKFWWELGIPRKLGKRLADDLRDLFKIGGELQGRED